MVALSAKLKERTTELIAAVKAKRGNGECHADAHVSSLRYDARLAYLDGRVARSKALHRDANRLARVLYT